MSLSVNAALHLPLLGSEGGDGGFESPSTGDFWWPLIGGDSHLALTRPAVGALLSVVVISWFYLSGTRRLSVVPTKRQWIVEQTYDFVRNTLGRDIIGAKDFRPFVPLLMTIFSFLVVNNVFGILPFIQYPTTARIGFPLVFALIVYITYNVVAIRRKHGVLGYLKSLVPPGLPGWLRPIMFILEALTYFVIRPVTLALRLFGNMLAGHLMLLVFILGGEYLLVHGSNLFVNASGVFSLLFAIVMTFFELLVEFLQAFIFTLLTALYLSDAVSEHH